MAPMAGWKNELVDVDLRMLSNVPSWFADAKEKRIEV